MRSLLRNRREATDHVWEAVRSEIRRVLEEHGLAHVAIDRAEEPPEQLSRWQVPEVILLAPRY